MAGRRRGPGLAGVLKAPAVAALFAAWALGALLGLLLGKLQRLCLGLSDVAADAIDVVRDA